MANTITFNLGGSATLNLTQTGPSSATLVEGGKPYSLGNIVVGSNSLQCDVVGMFGIDKAQINVTWAHDELTLTVSKSWLPSRDGTTTYQLSAQDMANWLAFLKVAAFPSN